MNSTFVEVIQRVEEGICRRLSGREMHNQTCSSSHSNTLFKEVPLLPASLLVLQPGLGEGGTIAMAG